MKPPYHTCRQPRVYVPTNILYSAYCDHLNTLARPTAGRLELDVLQGPLQLKLLPDATKTHHTAAVLSEAASQ